ncbi:MAG: radical SAM protein, partial [Clostridia bacterium]|nr:radical SAM protein [Clostridia bacterium]
RDKRLSVNCEPERFELASFWRLVRDPEYVRFLKEVGVRCVQLTFFGLEETTDRFIGRKGAFRELMQANELLLDNGISPRWQAFICEENREELVELLRLSEKLELDRRCAEFGGSFKFFIHAGSCDGENRKLYPIRIEKGHIPGELVPYFWRYDENLPESRLCAELRDDTSHVVFHNEDRIVLYVSNEYDLFFNFTHMRPEWRIGNLKTDPIEALVRRVTEEDTEALREANRITVGELVERYGDPLSEKVFEKEDYLGYLFNTHLERLFAEKR